MKFILAALLPLPSAAEGTEGITVGDAILLPARKGTKELQGTPAAAFGVDIYMVAWREGWHGKGGSARINAARVSEEGRLLDAEGIEVAPAREGVQERPRIAYSGGVFMVVWQDFRNGRDYDVLAARIDRGGKVLDREPIVIAGGPRNQVLPDIAGDGTGFLVAWQGLQGEESAYRGWAAPVSTEGKLGRAVETGGTHQPAIAWNGSRYLVACGGTGTFRGDVRAIRLSRDGAPEGGPILAIRGTKAATFSVSGVPGRGWLVVGHRSPPDPWGWGGPGAVRAALVTSDGRLENQDAVKEPAGVRERLPGWLDMGLRRSKGDTWPWGASAAAFDGRRSVVVWTRHHLCGEKMTNFENSDLIAARVEGYSSLDPQGVPVAASGDDETNPALAGGGDGRLLLAFERRSADGRRAVLCRIIRTE